MNGQRKAAVYAESLFQAARDAGTLAGTGADLAAFTRAMGNSPDLKAILLNPRIDSRAKKKAVAEIAAGADRLFLNALNLLIDKRVVAIIFDMESRYRALLKRQQGIVGIEVTSALALDEASRERIRGQLEAATGKKVELRETVDPGIIGGIIVRVGDTIIDSSLQGRLKALRKRMRRAGVSAAMENGEGFEAAT